MNDSGSTMSIEAVQEDMGRWWDEPLRTSWTLAVTLIGAELAWGKETSSRTVGSNVMDAFAGICQ